MTRLHPSIASIERSYRAWLKPAAEQSGQDEPPREEEATVPDNQRPNMPQWIADLVRRQVAARPEQAEPAVGDLVILSSEAAAERGDDSLPLVMLLDEKRRGQWFGWMVGAHADYAGSQDLVLDRSLLDDGKDPAPLAAFVQTWNRVHRSIRSPATILHRLTPEAMAAVRELALVGIDHEVAPSPGRMHSREVAGQSVMTGTPYGRHDPRDGYLLLVRELAAMVSEPQLDRRDREYGDDEPDV